MSDQHTACAKALFQLIDAETDHEGLLRLHQITLELMQLASGSAKNIYTELQLWTGLLVDTPDMGKAYRDVVARSYPWLLDQQTD